VKVLFNPDEAVTNAIRAVFEHLPSSVRRGASGSGSAPKVYRSPCRLIPPAGPVRSAGWPRPTTLSTGFRPIRVYAGAYTYGKTKYERYVDEKGVVKSERGICR
jgi:hypothetical protein